MYDKTNTTKNYNVLLKDSSLISENLPSSADINFVSSNKSNYLRSNIEVLPIKYVSQNTSLDINDDLNLPIVFDAQGNFECCLSNRWQVDHVSSSQWVFEDTDTGESDIYKNVLLSGSRSQLVVEQEDSGDHEHNLSAKNDLKYVERLVSVFVTRSSMLSETKKI
ncbi:hypothetical protein OGAPHI_007051 [Ogataea philodendri]|uniref:Uncharacterized protein n=1 Tax=Ogataea philodendri TaxID=1378263 RepID=A0A9P8NVH7_9ASCO|nr:uncharacterized protein OGAPHI_007051 [Ogataea philodendri]KAH3660465.1 hypothetical protein OGAPHI_007051 [Ogataea philodendri]